MMEEKGRYKRTARLESNEEIMLGSMEKRGFLDMRILFQVRDKEGIWRSLSGRNISVRKITNQGKLWQLVKRIFDVLSEAQTKNSTKEKT